MRERHLFIEFLFFSWYIAFYVISSMFLVVTICIYTYHTKLLNNYTRIMRQYALQLTMAFLLMAINKSIHFGNCKGGICGIVTCKLMGRYKIWTIKSNSILLSYAIYNTTFKINSCHYKFQDFSYNTSLSLRFHSWVHWQYSLGVRFSKYS